jgi:hypothetical protein
MMLFFPLGMSGYYFRVNGMFGSSLPPVVGRRAHVYCLCLLAHSSAQHILCCVFLLLVDPVLPVSLDCPLFIATSVFSGLSIVYYNFGILWIVHCLLQLRYSLTFIRTFWAQICNIIKNSKILKICNL